MPRSSLLGGLIALIFVVALLPGSGDGSRVGATTRGTEAAAVDGASWLDRLNEHRAAAGLGAVAEVPTWSQQARSHSNYLVINDETGHHQNPSNPGYSHGGALAGRNGNVVTSSGPLGEVEAIDDWMAAPFHGLAMLDPRLTSVGFGLVANPASPGVASAATLDVIRGLDWTVPWPSTPVVWPGHGSQVPIGSYDGGEWPDPLSSCGSGWTAPTGLPIIVMFPAGIDSVSATINGRAGASDVCVVTSTSYTNHDASAQTLGRQILASRNAAIVIARQPFPVGSTNRVDITARAGGSTYAASSTFSIGSTSAVATPVWAELKPGASGHWVASSNGAVVARGSASHHGGMDHVELARPIIAMQSTPSGNGYWLVASDGGVFTFGDAKFHGSGATIAARGATVALETTPSGQGYWIVTSAGEVSAFGDADFHGDLRSYDLAAPVVDITRTASGRGYWLVASDGGVFSFGDAGFHGSAGAIDLAQPVVGMEPTASGNGYWLVALDGGVFTYGDARFLGSAGGLVLGSPVRAITRTASGAGYWLLTERGQILPYGDATPVG